MALITVKYVPPPLKLNKHAFNSLMGHIFQM